MVEFVRYGGIGLRTATHCSSTRVSYFLKVDYVVHAFMGGDAWDVVKLTLQGSTSCACKLVNLSF
jgi:hypothetical protein